MIDTTLVIPELVFAWDQLHTSLYDDTGIDYSPYYGYRTPQESAQLYAKYQQGGPRAAPPWASPHNYGLAIDVVALRGSVQSWEPADYKPLIDALNVHAVLRSGASFSDSDHIELRYPPSPWTAALLHMLPELGPSDLVGRIWPLVRIMIARTLSDTIRADGGEG